MFLVLSTPAGNIISSRKKLSAHPMQGNPDSGIWEIFVCGMGDPGNFTCGIQNPERSWGAFLWDDPHQDHSDHGRSNEPKNALSRVDSSVHLIYHGPSDLGSLILIRIIPKDRTLGFLRQSCILDFMPWIRNSRYWILDSLSVEWIPDSNH